MPVAEIQGLVVRYGNFTALDGLTVTVPEGCIGLLGPNGAGKTTFLKTLLGFIDPVAGGGSILGHDLAKKGREIRQLIGLMPEQDCHIPGMSAVSFVAYAGELAGMPAAEALRRSHEVLEYAGLGEARYRNVDTYSTGMKQRVKFAQALVHGPKLLLLDEPTNGLDPRGREEMLNLVRSVSHGKGVNVIVSSHLLPDIERTCDQVMVVMNGKLRAQGYLKDLKRIEGHPVDIELKEANKAFESKMLERNAKLLESKSHTYRFVVPGTQAEVTKMVIATAHDTGAQVRGLSLAQRSLEEVFLTAVGATPPPMLQNAIPAGSTL